MWTLNRWRLLRSWHSCPRDVARGRILARAKSSGSWSGEVLITIVAIICIMLWSFCSNLCKNGFGKKSPKSSKRWQSTKYNMAWNYLWTQNNKIISYLVTSNFVYFKNNLIQQKFKLCNFELFIQSQIMDDDFDSSSSESTGRTSCLAWRTTLPGTRGRKSPPCLCHTTLPALCITRQG